MSRTLGRGETFYVVTGGRPSVREPLERKKRSLLCASAAEPIDSKWVGSVAKDKLPITQAVRMLKNKGANFILRTYKYEEKGGTPVASRELGVPEHQVIKTLVMEDEAKNPLLILMHGDNQVSTKNLARVLGVKSVEPCDPETAHRHTGYVVGGISPFGTRKTLKVYVEASILDLPTMYINAGKRGLLAEMSPDVLKRVLNPIPVTVAI